jgi:tubulin-specific chaperone A
MPRDADPIDIEKSLMVKVKTCQRYMPRFITISIVILPLGMFHSSIFTIFSYILNIRLEKESSYYKQEVIENENKLAQMRNENRDPYDIKKFQEVLGESVMMVPDSQARWQKSLEELSIFYEANKTDLNPESDWFIIAKKILVLQNGFLKEDEMMVTDDVAVTNVDQLNEGEAF